MLQASVSTCVMFFCYVVHAANRPFLRRAPTSAAQLAALGKELGPARTARLAYVFDYNTLESGLLITSTMTLLAGMVFSSGTLAGPFDSPGVAAVSVVLVLLLVVAIVGFALMLASEIWRSFQFSLATAAIADRESRVIKIFTNERYRGSRNFTPSLMMTAPPSAGTSAKGAVRRATVRAGTQADAAMSAVGNAARRTSAAAPVLLRAAFARGGGAEPSPRGRGPSPLAALVSSTRGPLRARSAPPRAGGVGETELMTVIVLPGARASPPPAACAQVAGGARAGAMEAPGGRGSRADRVLQVRSSAVSFVNRMVRQTPAAVDAGADIARAPSERSGWRDRMTQLGVFVGQNPLRLRVPTDKK